MTEKVIKNEQWYVKDLINKVNNHNIRKPKFQRKKKWSILPKKDTVPNEQSYIRFLFDTRNSVHAITFGQEANDSTICYSNIDGNNRINAIKHFMDTPFDIFPDYFSEIKNFIWSLMAHDKHAITESDANELIKMFQRMSYECLIHFKYPSYFKGRGHTDWYESTLKIHRDDFEQIIDSVQRKLKLSETEDFHTNAKVNVNIFEGYNTDELCKTFENINRFNSKLTEAELLASRLYNEKAFRIEDSSIEAQLKTCVKEYYERKSKDEALECYKFDTNDALNAHDFIVAFQNLCSTKCPFISSADTNDMPLFYKLFKFKYGGFADTFTTKNVNEFIKLITYACDVLTDVSSFIFTDQINKKLFNGACQKKLRHLSKNSIVVLMSCIFGHCAKKTDTGVVQKELQKCILFHFMAYDLKNKETKDEFKRYDLIAYQAGGAYVENKAKPLLKHPEKLNDRLEQAVFDRLITALCAESNDPHYRKDEKGSIVRKKRRALRFTDMCLMFQYYKERVPTNLLHDSFSIEHIVPNSSEWDQELDKDRTGNLVPIHASINTKRSNNHLSDYLKADKGSNFRRYIDILPDDDTYDSIVKHEEKADQKPKIHNNENYEIMCSKNEELYKTTFLQCLYKHE